VALIENRDELADTPAAERALDCIEAGIRAADPAAVIRERVRLEGDSLRIDPMGGAAVTYDLDAYEEVLVLGGGNAAGHVAAALEDVLGDRISAGVVVTDDPEPTDRIAVREGTHPIPSADNVEATDEILGRAEAAAEGTLIVAAITGGGSALMAAPAPGIELADLRTVTDAMLRAGLPIGEVNAVRKHLSAIKGGGLAEAAAPAPVVSLLFSDVIGDDPGVIASGPTAPDETEYADAARALERSGAETSDAVARRIEAGVAGEVAETADAEDLFGEWCRNLVLASGDTAIEAARRVASGGGFETLVLGSRIRGEAREAGVFHAAVAEGCLERGDPVSPPAVVLSGGETTVTVAGEGRGGPNLECALSAGLELRGRPIAFAAADTDGIDGNSGVAGALVTGDTVEEPTVAQDALDRNDASPCLAERAATIETGPTGTNVNDLRVLVLPGE
jgi:hydroxypyruvate reductase